VKTGRSKVTLQLSVGSPGAWLDDRVVQIDDLQVRVREAGQVREAISLQRRWAVSRRRYVDPSIHFEIGVLLARVTRNEDSLRDVVE
jgi:hypothetical protein